MADSLDTPQVSCSEVESEAFSINHDQWPKFDRYKPLNVRTEEIRVLEILPESGNAVLRCKLLHRSLTESPVYFALSYYWGAPTVLKPIIVDDVEVYIRETLHSFLEHLRGPEIPLVVWLDVLCINQKDITERNQQISMMGDIYKSATGVYAWLGEADKVGNDAFDYVAYVWSKAKTWLPQDVGWGKRCIAKMFKRPYWSRVWIVQEAVLARELWLVCGPQMVKWEDFEYAAHDTTVGHFAKFQVGWDLFRKIHSVRLPDDSEAKRTVCDLPVTFEKSSCVDPRDKVYGFRGIATDGRKLQVDYTKSTAEVFFDAVSLCKPVFEAYSAKGACEFARNLKRSMSVKEGEFLDAVADKPSDRFHEWAFLKGIIVKPPAGSELGVIVYKSNDPEVGTFATKEVILEELLGDRYCPEPDRLLGMSPGYRCYAPDTVQLGDLVYEFRSQGAWIVLREPKPYSKVVGRVLQTEDKDPRYLYENLMDLNIEVCCANAKRMPPLPQFGDEYIPSELLLHLDRSSLWAHFDGIDRPPRGLVEHLASKSLFERSLLCHCPLEAHLVEYTDAKGSRLTTVLMSQEDEVPPSLPWGS